MCIICVELDKNKLTPWEASRNLSEMMPSLDEEHIEEVTEKIYNALKEVLLQMDEKITINERL